ncbi:EF-P 5-aminopentanol modification-associated protein YfmH [Natranaerobius trueperi]|uniref:Peptidase M16 n=1 Tax=Natranaerobius trueperi TaxID=759412 RepID=A0A226BX19_9FIRM|nr:pitrilysin family protein [Natranaerobius trueperi]OWZ83322.1 peptidase M16 [Natranaerobius trueperi]
METKARIEKHYHPLVKETIYQSKTDNGLDIYVLPRKNFNKTYAIYAVNYGSIDNYYRKTDGEVKKVPDGIAHFLEHKLFEKKDGNIFNDFSDLGASANAFTTFGHTAYLFSATENFYESLDLLLNFVHEPYFTKENVEKEQGIIDQEISMYRDDPDWVVFFNLLEGIYHSHPVKTNIAGTESEIKRITPDLLYECHKTFYHPSNMVLFMIGNLEPEKSIEHVSNIINKKHFEEFDLEERIVPKEPESVFKSKVSKKLNVSKPRVYLGIKEQLASNSYPKLYDEVVTDLLLELIFGEGSKLYQELYDKQLIDNSFHKSYAYGRGFGFTTIGGSTNDPDKLIHKLEESIRNTAKEGIKKQDFIRVRNKLMGAYLKGFNSLEYLSNTFLNLYFAQDFLFDYSDIISKVSIDELQDRLINDLLNESKTASYLYPNN